VARDMCLLVSKYGSEWSVYDDPPPSCMGGNQRRVPGMLAVCTIQSGDGGEVDAKKPLEVGS